MKNIFQTAIQSVEEGANFKVDYQTRSLIVNGKYIIRNSEYEGQLGVNINSGIEFFEKIEELYSRYKHSVPSERSESKVRQYFTALPEKKLTDDDMLYGERRDKTQIELELYLLCQILNGFEWDTETMGKWFWQSQKDKDLVILRSWVEPINN